MTTRGPGAPKKEGKLMWLPIRVLKDSDYEMITKSFTVEERTRVLLNAIFPPDEQTDSAGASTHETKKPLGKQYYRVAKAIAKVVQWDFNVNRSRLFKEAQILMRADNPIPTPELILQQYDLGNWWYRRDWRGQKGEPPNPATIRQTWGNWQSVKPKRAAWWGAEYDELVNR